MKTWVLSQYRFRKATYMYMNIIFNIFSLSSLIAKIDSIGSKMFKYLAFKISSTSIVLVFNPKNGDLQRHFTVFVIYLLFLLCVTYVDI
jgi:hypothetical protein